MGFRIGFKVAPGVYYSHRLGGRRRRKGSSSPTILAIAAALVAIAIGVAFPIAGIVLVAIVLGVAITTFRRKRQAQREALEAASPPAPVPGRDYTDWREWSTNPKVRADLLRERGEL